MIAKSVSTSVLNSIQIQDVRRVLLALNKLGIDIPSDVLLKPPHEGPGIPFAEYTYLEHAILDWFEKKDSEEASAMLSASKPVDTWCRVDVLGDDSFALGDVTQGLICHSYQEALVATLKACDYQLLRFDSLNSIEGGFSVFINGQHRLNILRIDIEPLDLHIRNRVRTALKGVRQRDGSVYRKAAALPGYKLFKSQDVNEGESNGAMLLGFPSNWALAMRNALRQVGIEVKQNQAQEVVAAYFGAANWHQLIQHQDELNAYSAPVMVKVISPKGDQTLRYYHTSEEAVFAGGKAAEAYDKNYILTVEEVRHQIFNESILSVDIVSDATPDPSLESSFNGLRIAVCVSGVDYCYELEHADQDVLDKTSAILSKMNDGATSCLVSSSFYSGTSAKDVLESLILRSGGNIDKIEYFGDIVCAMIGESRSHLYVYRFAEKGPERVLNGGIAAYKAKAILANHDRNLIEIRGDYGNHNPVYIPVTKEGDVERFTKLTGIRIRESLYL